MREMMTEILVSFCITKIFRDIKTLYLLGTFNVEDRFLISKLCLSHLHFLQ